MYFRLKTTIQRIGTFRITLSVLVKGLDVTYLYILKWNLCTRLRSHLNYMKLFIKILIKIPLYCKLFMKLLLHEKRGNESFVLCVNTLSFFLISFRDTF